MYCDVDNVLFTGVRLRSAKKGIFLMSWDMKVVIEQRVGRNHSFVCLLIWLLLPSLSFLVLTLFSLHVSLLAFRHCLFSLQQEYDGLLWAIDTSPTGQKPTAKDWVYPPDQQREVSNQSLGNLVTLMKIIDKASKEKRMLTMTGA